MKPGFLITANAEHTEFLILTAVFTFDIRDHSNKCMLDHKHKINYKSLEIFKEKLKSDSFEKFFVNRTALLLVLR